MGPPVRQCRIEAEEGTGDLGRFAKQGEWVLGIDPIDGTRGYRDRIGTEYAVMLHARTRETIHYSLVFLPEESAEGTWLEVRDGRIVLGPDDPSRAARAALDALSPIAADRPAAPARPPPPAPRSMHCRRWLLIDPASGGAFWSADSWATSASGPWPSVPRGWRASWDPRHPAASIPSWRAATSGARSSTRPTSTTFRCACTSRERSAATRCG